MRRVSPKFIPYTFATSAGSMLPLADTCFESHVSGHMVGAQATTGWMERIMIPRGMAGTANRDAGISCKWPQRVNVQPCSKETEQLVSNLTGTWSVSWNGPGRTCKLGGRNTPLDLTPSEKQRLAFETLENWCVERRRSLTEQQKD